MKLIQSIEILLKRPVSAEEAAKLSDFQRLHSIDDDDPLIVVLALMAQSHILVQTLPDLLQQKAKETIEMHQVLLRDQAVVITKELIQTIAGQIQEASNKQADTNWKVRYTRYLLLFVGGALMMDILIRVTRHFA